MKTIIALAVLAALPAALVGRPSLAITALVLAGAVFAARAWAAWPGQELDAALAPRIA